MYNKSEHVSVFVGERENLWTRVHRTIILYFLVFLYSVDNLTFLVSCSPLSIRVSVREKVYGGSLSVAPNSMAGRP